MRKVIFIDFSKLLIEGADGTTITHAMFKWDSLRRFLQILSKTTPRIFLLNFPAEFSYSSMIEFWIDNCYPGRIAGYSAGCGKDIEDSILNDIGMERVSHYSLTENPGEQLTDKDVKLAIYSLRD